MTVGELIERLKLFPPDLLTMRGDNSGSYEAITDQPRWEPDVPWPYESRVIQAVIIE